MVKGKRIMRDGRMVVIRVYVKEVKSNATQKVALNHYVKIQNSPQMISVAQDV